MALLGEPWKCWHGDVNCERHSKTKPDLSDLPPVDSIIGRCVAEGGHGTELRVWVMPLDHDGARGPLCRKHVRELMRRATWPFTIRFPDE